MAELRTLLAAVLGVGLGAVLLAYPEAVIRAQTAGRVPDDRGGEYGQGREIPVRWTRIVRGLGVVVAGAGLYFGYVALA